MDSGGLLFTGLYWERDQPVLTGLVGCEEHVRPLQIGQALGWQVLGPRRCIGVYERREHRRRHCPAGSLVIDDSQCELCQREDPGRLVARGQAPAEMEHEPFVLYLASFGVGLNKVGMTAEERGVGRLCEQAALSYCLIARGTFEAVRQAEVLLSSISVAPERISARAKQASWWEIPSAEERTVDLAALRAAAAESLGPIAGIERLDTDVVDLASRFGLERELPDSYELVTGVQSGAVLAGEVSHVIGRDLVLGPTPIVVDARLLEGWTLRRSSQPTGGLVVVTRNREADARAVQAKLF